MRLGVIVT